MKKKHCFAICRSLAWSLVFSACFWSIAAQGADTASPQVGSRASTKALTLDNAIGLALDNNPELRASRGQIDSATGRARQARLWSNPELTLNAEDWPVKDGRGFADSKDTVGIAQTVPFFGKKRLDGQIGGAGVRLSEADLSLRRLELIRDVKVAFCQVLAAERSVEVERDLVKIAEASANAARKRVASGESADQEQLRAEIELEKVKTELRGFESELVATRQTLALHLGRPDLAQSPVSGALAESASFALLEHVPEQWLSMHPSVVAAQTNCDRAELELRRARLEPYPDVKVSLEGGRLGDFNQPIIQMGISLPLPIIDRAQGKKQEAQANVRIAEAAKTSTEQRLMRAWGTASQRLRAAQQQALNFRERILPKANDALGLVQAGFEQGKFGFNDLLDTQRTTAEVRLAYQQKLLELNIAHAELEALAVREPDTAKTLEPKESQKKKTKL